MRKSRHQSLGFWHTAVRDDGLLSAWIDSPLSFVPPEKWPECVYRWLVESGFVDLEPYMVAHDFLPTDRETRRRGLLYKSPPDVLRGFGVLSALSHNWPWHLVHGPDRVRLQRAIRFLEKSVPFAIWYHNPMWVGIPLGDSKGPGRTGHMDLVVRHSGRATLESNPLGASRVSLVQGMSPVYRNVDIIRDLPQKPWSPRSRRYPLIRGLSRTETALANKGGRV